VAPATPFATDVILSSPAGQTTPWATKTSPAPRAANDRSTTIAFAHESAVAILDASSTCSLTVPLLRPATTATASPTPAQNLSQSSNDHRETLEVTFQCVGPFSAYQWMPS